jgi:hypothetical protein
MINSTKCDANSEIRHVSQPEEIPSVDEVHFRGEKAVFVAVERQDGDYSHS